MERLVDYDIGYSQNGTYHLTIAKALCYKGLGQLKKATELMSQHIEKYEGGIGVYDYLHLGVLYLESKDYKKAIEAFDKQAHEYNCAENNFYLAIAHGNLGKNTKEEKYLRNAKNLYKNKRFMFDPYTHQVDKVYLKEIEAALVSLNLGD